MFVEVFFHLRLMLFLEMDIADKCTSVFSPPSLFVLININWAFCCDCYSGTGATLGCFYRQVGKSRKQE